MAATYFGLLGPRASLSCCRWQQSAVGIGEGHRVRFAAIQGIARQPEAAGRIT